MSESNARRLTGLARGVLALLVILVAAGALVHGISDGVWARLVHDLLDRPDGPMRFRFILQPVMAAIAAVRDGKADAVAGRGPYLSSIIRLPEERIPRLREGLNATARIILLGIVMDIIYQWLVLKTFYPGEAVLIALLLCYIPYMLLRGLVLRSLRIRAHLRGGAQ